MTIEKTNLVTLQFIDDEVMLWESIVNKLITKSKETGFKKDFNLTGSELDLLNELITNKEETHEVL